MKWIIENYNPFSYSFMHGNEEIKIILKLKNIHQNNCFIKICVL